MTTHHASIASAKHVMLAGKAGLPAVPVAAVTRDTRRVCSPEMGQAPGPTTTAESVAGRSTDRAGVVPLQARGRAGGIKWGTGTIRKSSVVPLGPRPEDGYCQTSNPTDG